MKREDFRQFVLQTLEKAIRTAEDETGRKLSRKIAFRWFQQKTPPLTENIAEHITGKVFISGERIYPCVDIGVEDVLADGTVLISANIAGYEPGPFPEINRQGGKGPFNYIIGQKFLDKIKREG
jgi:hypothetical protein